MIGRRLGVLLLAGLVFAGCSSSDDDENEVAVNASSQCGVDKLDALADYCGAYFAEDASAADLAQAGADLGAALSAAESAAASQDLPCDDLALSAEDAEEIIAATRDVLAAAVGGQPNGTDCAGRFFDAAADMCETSLDAEARYYLDQEQGSAAGTRNEQRESARADFLARSDATLADGCVEGDEEDIEAVSNSARAQLDALIDELALKSVSAGNLDASQYITLSPTGTVQYEGRGYTPVCMNGSPYHFFAKRGTVNKLVMYYQGGGACWEKLTCSVPACDTNVDPEGGDNPNGRTGGFADATDNRNPFRNWHVVVVSYCGCDVHFGDAEQDYVSGPGDPAPLHVEHRGYHNAKVAEKWAREHFLAPDEVFVTGSSAGAYGAWFHAPLLHDVWPNANFHVFADAGNGVITQDFLESSFPNWNFEANLPADIPAIQEVLDSGTGIPGYTEVVADEFPDTNWAHYTTAYDGGSGGQTGFYNIMLNDNDPIAALSWWEGSCQFNEDMREQAIDTSAAVPDNYRYYIGTGSRHTIWGSDKVYGVEDPNARPTEQKITTDVNVVTWVNAMLASDSSNPNPAWSNFECEDCGLVLPGDPQPNPPVAPFVQDGDDLVIDCE